MDLSSLSFLFSGSSAILIIGGFLIGTFSVVIGGGMFFSVPFMQWMFPGASFGVLVGNIKVSSFFRALASTYATRHLLDFRRDINIAALAFVGTVIGASFIANLDQRWLFFAVLFAVVIGETAPWIARFITSRTFYIASFLTGIYAGLFGAGLGIFLVVLLRLRYPQDVEVAIVKIQARFLEFFLTISAVLTHWYHGNLRLSILVPLSIGTFVGGIVGGLLLKKLSTLSGTFQKTILHIAFAFALFVAGWSFFA